MQTSANASPCVSVVIPTYNRVHVLGRAIKSVLAQSFPDFECIVVDDGSTDGTVEAVESFQDPRVRCVRLATNGGVSRARNEGIQVARGELVAFLDSDDEWLPRKLELQVARLRESEDARTTVAYCAAYKYDEFRNRMGIHGGAIYEGDVFDPLLTGWYPPTASLFIVKRSSLLDVGGFDEGLACAEDYDLWLRLAQTANHFVAVNVALAIKHENIGPQLSSDPATRLAGSRVLERKWRGVIRHHLAPAAYRRWKAKRYDEIQSTHFRRVRQAVAHGQRMAAWRYWLAMCRLLPWSRRNVIHALALVTLGQGAYGALARAKEAFLKARRGDEAGSRP
jgi:glycosyltransferase involved in cell wall biosynthesis